MIYLDYAAATPMRREVLRAMEPYFSERFANPTAAHPMGLQARDVVEKSRVRIADVLNCSAGGIVFTTGGTESNNLALLGFGGLKLVVDSTSHKSVLEAARNSGKKVVPLSVDGKGRVDLKELGRRVTRGSLVSICYVNNETGVIQDVKRIARIVHAKKGYLHIDACQAGLFELDVGKLGVDMMTLNAGKIYGPKGVGLLYVHKGVDITSIMFGGGQEGGLRSGTPNTAGIIGMGKALDLMVKGREKERNRLEKLSTWFVNQLSKDVGRVNVIGSSKRSPHIVSLLFDEVDSEDVVNHLYGQGICVSRGSACQSGEIELSHVLKAMKIEKTAIRFSFGRDTTKKELGEVIAKLIVIVDSLRAIGF